MKYAKKMRLVEINDDEYTNTHTKNIDQHIYTMNDSDDTYFKPKVLSSLDKEMDAILRNSEMNEYDKWNLYKRTLHKYLNFIDTTRKSGNVSDTSSNKEKNQKDWLNNTFTEHPPRYTRVFDTAASPKRDSLDKVTAPLVREFFENIRASGKRDNHSPRVNESQTSSPLNSADDEMDEGSDDDIYSTHGVSDLEIDDEPAFDRTNDINTQFVTNRHRKNKKHTFSPVVTRNAALKRRADLGISMMREPKKNHIGGNLIENWESCLLPY